MAIKRSEVIEQDIFKNTVDSANELLLAIKSLKDEFVRMGEESKKVIQNNPFKKVDDVKAYNKAVDELKVSQDGIAQANEIELKLAKEKEALQKKLIALDSDQAKENTALKLQIAEKNKALKEEIQLTKGTILSIEELTKRNKALRKEVRQVDISNKEGQKRVKELNAQIDANTKLIKENSDTLLTQKMNIGNYSNSILDAIDRTGVLSKSMNFATKAMGGANTAMKATGIGATVLGRVVTTALISTGIGALIPLIGGLVLWFQKTQVGADLLKKGFVALSTTVSVVVDRITGAVSAVYDFITGSASASETQNRLKASIQGVGDEIATEVKQMVELEDAMQKVKRASYNLRIEQAATRAEIKQLNKIAEDVTEPLNKRVEAAAKAVELEEGLLNKRLEIQRKKAAEFLGLQDITEERLAEIRKNGLELSDLGVSESMDEDLDAATQALADYFNLVTESAEMQTTITNKLNILRNQQQKEYLESLKETLEPMKAVNKESLDLAKSNRELATANEAVSKSLNDKVDKINAESEALKKLTQQQENYQVAVQTVTKFTSDAITSRENRLKEAISFEQNLVSNNIEVQKRLAEKGLANTLATEQKRQFELEQRRERQAKRERARKEAEVFLNLVAEYSKEGNPSQATTKALTQLSVAKGLAALISGSAFEGVEDTGGAGGLDGKGGKLWMLHPHERVLNRDQNETIQRYFGKITNDELVKVATEKTTTTIEKPVKIQNHLNINVDELGNFIETKIDNGKKSIIRHIRKRNIQ